MRKERTGKLIINTEFLFIRCEKKYVQVAFADILYCMAKNHHCIVVAKHQTYIVSNALSDIERNLPRHLFVKIHASYTVSIARIHSFERTWLKLHPPEPGFKKGYAEVTDFKIALTYQSAMRDPLLIVVGRSGGDAYRYSKMLTKTKMETYEDEMDICAN